MLSLATIPHFCVIIIVAAMAPFSFVWELIGFCQNHPKSFGTSCLTYSPLSLVGNVQLALESKVLSRLLCLLSIQSTFPQNHFFS